MDRTNPTLATCPECGALPAQPHDDDCALFNDIASVRVRGALWGKAARVSPFVQLYRAAYDRGEDDEVVMTDLLADLAHFASFHEVDFDAVVDKARMHAAAERSGEVD